MWFHITTNRKYNYVSLHRIPVTSETVQEQNRLIYLMKISLSLDSWLQVYCLELKLSELKANPKHSIPWERGINQMSMNYIFPLKNWVHNPIPLRMPCYNLYTQFYVGIKSIHISSYFWMSRISVSVVNWANISVTVVHTALNDSYTLYTVS